MTLDEMPWDTGTDAAVNNGAKGRKCRRHVWEWTEWAGDQSRVLEMIEWCAACHRHRDPIASRRSKNNGKRGRRAELTIAREIPGARKMGPLGLPWDVEVGEYARLQVKKLVARPSANAIRKLIEAIPNTGDRLRGFVWVEAAGRGKRGRRQVWFTWDEFVAWHGIGEVSAWDSIANLEAIPLDNLVMLPLADWVAEFVAPGVTAVAA
jgi:hypothetical protein